MDDRDLRESLEHDTQEEGDKSRAAALGAPVPFNASLAPSLDPAPEERFMHDEKTSDRHSIDLDARRRARRGRGQPWIHPDNPYIWEPR